MRNSTTVDPAAKPRRPKVCPLFAHATGRWAKKIRGRLVYFGRWDDLDGALRRWAEQNDALLAGLPVESAKRSVLTVRELVNEFLNSRRLRIESGELAQRTFADYVAVGTKLADVLGRTRAVESLTPADFERLRSIVAKGEHGRGRWRSGFPTAALPNRGNTRFARRFAPIPRGISPDSTGRKPRGSRRSYSPSRSACFRPVRIGGCGSMSGWKASAMLCRPKRCGLP